MPAPASRLSPLGALDVLLVEDSPGDAELLVEHLRDEGPAGAAIHVCRVDRLARAIDALAARARDGAPPPDAILLDLMLPDSEGIETVQRMRAAAPNVPLVVVTGMASEAMAIEAARHGAQDYLLKNEIDGATLVRAVRCAVEHERGVCIAPTDNPARRRHHVGTPRDAAGVAPVADPSRRRAR